MCWFQIPRQKSLPTRLAKVTAGSRRELRMPVGIWAGRIEAASREFYLNLMHLPILFNFVKPFYDDLLALNRLNVVLNSRAMEIATKFWVILRKKLYKLFDVWQQVYTDSIFANVSIVFSQFTKLYSKKELRNQVYCINYSRNIDAVDHSSSVYAPV